MGTISDNRFPGATADDTAERWFVRLLEPDCNAEERAAFERWRRGDPTRDAAYRRVERLWAQGEQAVRDPAVMSLAMRELRDTEPARRSARHWYWPVAAMAAAVVIAVAIVPGWFGESEPPAGTRYATVAGEQRNVQLSDGSSLTLDTGTVLVERYSDGERRIDLEQGRADFQVQHDAARPFVVHAQGGTVTAIGTEFQVRVGATDALVTLLTGKVAVAAGAERGNSRPPVKLAAGEQVGFDRAGHVGTVRTVDLKAARGWTEGKLFVQDWPLPDLLAEMNRYSETRLRIGDPALADIRVSGVFKTGDQDTLLLILKQGWSIESRPAADGQVVLTRQ